MKNVYSLFIIALALSSCFKNEEVYKMERAKITNIILREYPLTNNGESWDEELPGSIIDSTPDPILIISGPNYYIAYGGSPNLNGSHFATYSDLVISKLDSTYTFDMYDNDYSPAYFEHPPNQWMSSFNWIPSSTRTSENSEWISLTSENAAIDMRVEYFDAQ